ncbi:bifunctional lysine ketoglutarate reductase /saccharopine dehydrogenase family protein [uncultured Desulfobacter sp.]|uniref:bifunctional lysine ketoglutarate reductase /saccharopine dehydrogenase family protein n=1 Tax=uncultured Desulfobacter sp. TaxID=240139 RepID=UPI0029F48161|nr:bifunctional lysine ketoglutarate reductase /saccharopine dehydrogenase family protein [uncultured Desulfobacter sp.]
MKKYLGIRREDKNKWERRVPLIPEDVKELKDRFGIEAVVQPSALRIYTDDEFEKNKAIVQEDLSQVDTVFAVKEIPVDLLAQGKTYIFFSHTIKGQPYNMGLLQKLVDLKCNLIDYERIVNEKNQRLIFFGAHAGYAGMVETLFAFAQKLSLKGIHSPLDELKQAYAYASLDEAKAHVKSIGETIASQGLPEQIAPLVVGFAGYGNVSQGAQQILDILPVKEISPDQITQIREAACPDRHHIYKVVFKEADMVTPINGEFSLQEYYDHPEKYRSVMDGFLPHMDILVNCIYWTEDYPRIVTAKGLQESVDKPYKLSVIGDISCDIEGSIEITKDATMPDNACFTYLPGSDAFEAGITTDGITVMAIDNLPCEFSKESSIFFSQVLKGFAPDIVNADFDTSFDALELPYAIKKALILHKGQFTPDYEYMKEFI